MRVKGRRAINMPRTPEQDQPKTNRAYPLMVREGGPAQPTYGGGSSTGRRGVDSHPIYNGSGPRGPVKRVDTSQDARRELGA